MTWRKTPLEVGCSYRVRCDFTVRGESFVAGELLVYRGDVYSRYDGFSGYSFQKAGAEQIRSFEVLDTDDAPKWSDLFEELQNNEIPVA